jgi:hypothetical protein
MKTTLRIQGQTMKDLPLTSSVGTLGENLAEDVLAIQKALNEARDKIGLDETLAEDGIIGDDFDTSKTCQAIKQKRLPMNWALPQACFYIG